MHGRRELAGAVDGTVRAALRAAVRRRTDRAERTHVARRRADSGSGRSRGGHSLLPEHAVDRGDGGGCRDSGIAGLVPALRHQRLRGGKRPDTPRCRYRVRSADRDRRRADIVAPRARHSQRALAASEDGVEDRLPRCDPARLAHAGGTRRAAEVPQRGALRSRRHATGELRHGAVPPPSALLEAHRDNPQAMVGPARAQGNPPSRRRQTRRRCRPPTD